MTNHRRRSRPRMTAFGAAVVAAIIAAAMFGIAPAMADKSNDDLQCPVNHCVNGSDLAYGDTNNLAEDASFERSPAALLPASPSWPARGAASAPQWSVMREPDGNRLCYSGVRCATRAGNGTASTASLTNAVYIEAAPGDTFAVEGYLKALNAPTGTGGVQLTWYSELAGSRPTFLRNDVVTTAPTSAWTKRRVVAVAPANTSYMTAEFIVRDHSAGSWYADSMRLERLTTLDDVSWGLGFGLVRQPGPGGTTVVSADTSKVQHRINGGCPAGVAVTGVNVDGTVKCGGPKVYELKAAPHECPRTCIMGTLSGLPRGSYLLSAHAQIRVHDGKSEPFDCDLSTDEGKSTRASVEAAVVNEVSAQLATEITHDAATVKFSCRLWDAYGGGYSAGEARISALSLGSIVHSSG